MKVQKKNQDGEVIFQYEGEVLQRGESTVTLQAYFGNEDRAVSDVLLKKGDRFVETFYSDRWYNIFEIYDRDDGKLKGWYCNIGKPAVIEQDMVSYVDLALDLWVAPDGTQTILDEDELAGLKLDDELKQMAFAGLRELQSRFKANTPPF